MFLIVDPGITVNIIRDGKTIEKKNLSLPERVEGVSNARTPDAEHLLNRSFLIFSSLLTEKKAFTDASTAKARLKSKTLKADHRIRFLFCKALCFLKNNGKMIKI